MHLLWSAAVQYTNYGTGGAFELPTQSGTYALYTHLPESQPEGKCIYTRQSMSARGIIDTFQNYITVIVATIRHFEWGH